MDIKTLVKERTDELLQDLGGLIKIPSVKDLKTASESAPFGEAVNDALNYVLELGDRDGFITRNLEGYAGVVEFGEGEEILGILGHLDVVPVGTGWDFDPWSGEVRENYILGRGSQDDKGPTMAAYYAMKVLKEAGYQPKKRVLLIVGTDEESGMQCMEYYHQHGEKPTLGFVPDADFPLVYGEKGILNLNLHGKVDTQIVSLHGGERPNIVVGEAHLVMKGSAQQEFFDFYCQTHGIEGSYREEDDLTSYTFYGEYAHGSTPEEGNNAAWHALNFAGAAYNDDWAMDVAKLLSHLQGKSLGIDSYDPHMRHLSMNLGVARIENQEVSLVLDIRYPQSTNDQVIEERIRHALNRSNTHLLAEVLAHKKPLFVDPESTLVKTLTEIYRSYTKDTTPLLTMGGGTYARSFDNFVAYGPNFPGTEHPDWVGNIHQANEAYSVKHLLLATMIYAQAIVELSR